MKKILFLFTLTLLTIGGGIQAEVHQNESKEKKTQTQFLESHTNLPQEEHGFMPHNLIPGILCMVNRNNCI